MRVDWAVLCRYVEVNNGLATIVGAGIDRYGVGEFPAELNLVVAVRLAGLPDDADHTLQVTILDPMMAPVGEPIPPATFKLNQGAGDHPEGWEANVLVPMQIRIAAQESGAYTLDVNVDGHSHTTIFRIVGPA